MGSPSAVLGAEHRVRKLETLTQSANQLPLAPEQDQIAYHAAGPAEPTDPPLQLRRLLSKLLIAIRHLQEVGMPAFVNFGIPHPIA
jgi:hypothetical protein